MKKSILFLLLFSLGVFINAQDKGMQFEHNTSWEKVLAKAKAENKFIFVDCLTTWCGPCKEMSKNIFPREDVGAFFNKNFISVKIQLDTTKEDNEDVKSWYAAGKEIATKYNVRAYPTYLMFDPNGQIVHRAVGSSPADKFLAKGADAINPEKQYYGLKRQYESGKKEEKFLYALAKAANDGYDKPFADKVVSEYLATQTDLLTKENIEFMAFNISKSKDFGFPILLKNPEAFDKVIGPGFSQSILRSVITREEILPALFPNGQKDNPVPNWDNALKVAGAKYPKEAPEAVAFYKISLLQRKSEWKGFGPAVVEYMTAFGSNVPANQMNSFAWAVFQNCEDMSCVASALEWSKQSFANEPNHAFVDTYANLLYKSGKKKEAIEWEIKARDMALKAGVDAKSYVNTLEKMEKGEKTW